MQGRKQYFVKKGMQTRFIGTVLLIILLVLVVVSCNFYFFGMYFIQQADEKQVDVISAVFSKALALLKWRLVLLGAVNILIIIMIGLFFSHQIAGPVYKLEKNVSRVLEGDLTVDFKFRKSDKLDELSELLNAMRDSFKGSLLQVREVALKLKELANKKEIKATDENTLLNMIDTLLKVTERYTFEKKAQDDENTACAAGEAKDA